MKRPSDVAIALLVFALVCYGSADLYFGGYRWYVVARVNSVSLKRSFVSLAATTITLMRAPFDIFAAPIVCFLLSLFLGSPAIPILGCLQKRRLTSLLFMMSQLGGILFGLICYIGFVSQVAVPDIPYYRKDSIDLALGLLVVGVCYRMRSIKIFLKNPLSGNRFLKNIHIYLVQFWLAVILADRPILLIAFLLGFAEISRCPLSIFYGNNFFTEVMVIWGLGFIFRSSGLISDSAGWCAHTVVFEVFFGSLFGLIGGQGRPWVDSLLLLSAIRTLPSLGGLPILAACKSDGKVVGRIFFHTIGVIFGRKVLSSWLGLNQKEVPESELTIHNYNFTGEEGNEEGQLNEVSTRSPSPEIFQFSC